MESEKPWLGDDEKGSLPPQMVEQGGEADSAQGRWRNQLLIVFELGAACLTETEIFMLGCPCFENLWALER